MTNIKAIYAGNYVDEISIDGLDDNKKGGSTPVIASAPRRQTLASTEI
jgi:hypothetical protein